MSEQDRSPPDLLNPPGARPLQQGRLIDGLRFLPFVGLVLWWFPLLWPHSSDGMRSSMALIYLFVVWSGLSLLAAFLLWRLAGAERRARGDKGGPET